MKESSGYSTESVKHIKSALCHCEFIIRDTDGGFSIRSGMSSNKIWIERTHCDAAGEGMECEASLLLEVIRKFYEERF